MKNLNLKYLNLYKQEYSNFKTLEKLPKKTLQKLGKITHLKMPFYNKNKNILAKGIYITLGGHTPVNFDKW
jgi:hypothetical protein